MCIRVILKLSTKCVSIKVLFQEMQEKHDEEKSSNSRLLVIFVGHIGIQDLLEISAD